MAKILMADDEVDLEALIRQKFRRKIKDREYEFVFAINGNDALEKLKENPDIDIVLSDINMPEMDGLTLLAKLHAENPLVKTVIVSAYGDMENIRTAMNRGAFDFVTKPINFDDLSLTMEKTLRHVEQLKETLKSVKENNILKMYVDETVLNFMGSREFESTLMANESIDASVAFIDICQFTSISENLPPDAVIGLLNRYFDVMVKKIIDNGGSIDKFIGDAIMAVFTGDKHLENAVRASIAVRDEIEKLPPISDEITFLPKVSIGVNSGEMISGNVGSESLRRLDYTVIGDVVNTAQRLQTAAEPGQIVVSKKIADLLWEEFLCKEVGRMKLKNKAEEMHVYQVLGAK